MSKVERLYHLHNILNQRRTPISRQELMERLECSQATLYRLVAELRDFLGAPLEQDAPDHEAHNECSDPADRSKSHQCVHIFSETIRHAVTQPTMSPAIMQNTVNTYAESSRPSIHLPSSDPSAVGTDTDQPIVPIIPTDCQNEESPSRSCSSRSSRRDRNSARNAPFRFVPLTACHSGRNRARRA